jgi:hypothetical protein
MLRLKYRSSNYLKENKENKPWLGHSNTVEMIEALGGKTNPSIKDQDYDYLFLLTISASGKQKSKSCITGNPIPTK